MVTMEMIVFTSVVLFVLAFSIAWGFSIYVDQSSKGKRYIPVYGILSVLFLGWYTWYGLIRWGVGIFSG